MNGVYQFMSGILPQNNGVQIFNYENHEVRTISIDGEPWWVASDVCSVLKIQNIRQNLGKLDDDEKGVCTVYTLGGAQQMAIVNEPGLYSLILTSRKKEAKEFKRWITHDVIPSIRKTGSYASPAQPADVHKFTKMLADRAMKNLARVPDGFFAVLPHLFYQLQTLEQLTGNLDEDAKLEISVGKGWRQHAIENLHLSNAQMIQYRHVLANGRIVDAWAYSDIKSGDFYKWLWTVYFPEKFPSYVEYRKTKLALPAPKAAKPKQIKGGNS
jgi:prophage antirepressor-like protein